MKTDAITIGGIVLSPGLAQGMVHLHRTMLGAIDVAQNGAKFNIYFLVCLGGSKLLQFQIKRWLLNL